MTPPDDSAPRRRLTIRLVGSLAVAAAAVAAIIATGIGHARPTGRAIQTAPASPMVTRAPGRTSPPPTATASREPLVLALFGEPAPMLQLRDLSGHQIRAIPVDSSWTVGGTFDNVGPQPAVPFAVVAVGDTVLRIDRDGMKTALLAVGGPTQELAGAAIAPDGQHVAYSTVTFANDLSATTVVHVVDAAGGSPAAIATLKRAATVANSTYAGGYRVIGWDKGGIVLGTDPTGVGGGGPFPNQLYIRALVVRLNPGTATLSRPLVPTGCSLADIAGDGTIACFEGWYSGGVTLDLISSDGRTQRQPLPGVLAAGSAHFTGHDHDVVFGGVATEDSQPVTMYVLSGTAIRTVVTNVWSSIALVDDSTIAVQDATSARMSTVNLSTGTRTTIGDGLTMISVVH